jgi:pimeloyl-ACP methyl ester carboxylesterase
MKVLRALYDQRPQDMFARLRCPVLIAPAGGGAGGAAFLERKREAIERAAAALPHATVRWFEDSVHDIPLHHPRELAEAIGDFAEAL